jgi:phosphotriesterase-related protein
MTERTAPWTDQVMTTAGLRPPADLGVTLPHEHLLVQGWDYRERNYLNSATMELVKFIQAGGRTLVELSSVGLPRDPRFCQTLAERVGVQVVIGTGYYKHAWLPEPVHAMTVEQLAGAMTRDIVDGIDDTGIHAGVIGELGVSRTPTPTEERVLAAAAQTQRATGAAISLHFDIGCPVATYRRALDVIERAGADLARVAVGHLVARPDNLSLCRELAARGCYLEFDLFGQERRRLTADLMQTHPDVQASSIRGFIDHGMLDHLLLSQDVRHVELWTVNGGDGYAHLLKNVVPVLRAYSVSQAELDTLLIDNPRRLLALADKQLSLW